MAHHSLVASGTTCLGAIWNIEITNENAKKKKNVVLNRLQKEYLFRVWELKQKCRWLKVGYCLVWSQSGACSIGKFKIFLLSAWLQMTVKAALALVLGLQINFREEANSQIWNPQIMRTNCKYVCVCVCVCVCVHMGVCVSH